MTESGSEVPAMHSFSHARKVQPGKSPARLHLTARQEDVIQTACENGYFDIPKKINLKELADCFDVCPATLCEILQRAERKVISEYVATHRGNVP